MRTPPTRVARTVVAALALLATAAAATAQYSFCGPCVTTVLPGPVVGQTWTPAGSPYCVTGNIVVAGLTIQPGVVVRFASGAKLSVLTTIDAQGSAASPIVFTSATSTSTWGGIDFVNTPPGSILKYCRVERSSNSGIRITNSSPTIDHCAIVDNTAPGNGGGILASLGSGQVLTVNRSQILRNRANPQNGNGSFNGGGIYVDGDCVLEGCLIEDNEAFSNCSTLYCQVSGLGGGVHVASGDATITTCFFRSNKTVVTTNGGVGGPSAATAMGGGLAATGASLVLKNSVLCGNESEPNGACCFLDSWGSGLYSSAATTVVENCVVSQNAGEGIRRDGGAMTVRNSIVYFNTGPEIVGTVSVNYSNVEGGAPGSGVGNIDLNPAFVANTGPFLTIGDVGLLLGSPCVDAGDPASAYDDQCSWPSLTVPSACASGAGSRNDMGAFGGPGACDWNDAPNDSSWGFGLEGSPSVIPLGTGGTYTLTLNAGCQFAGQTFVLGGTTDGIAPGFSLGGFWIPLNNWNPCFVPNPWFAVVLTLGPGTLNMSGTATIVFQVPAMPALAGTVFHHAYGVINFASPTPIQFVSNAARVQ